MPVDVFAERNAHKDDEDTKYVIVSQSTKSKEKVSLFVKIRKFLGVSHWVTKLRAEIWQFVAGRLCWLLGGAGFDAGGGHKDKRDSVDQVNGQSNSRWTSNN